MSQVTLHLSSQHRNLEKSASSEQQSRQEIEARNVEHRRNRKDDRARLERHGAANRGLAGGEERDEEGDLKLEG